MTEAETAQATPSPANPVEFRAIAPPFYTFTAAIGGMTFGFTSVALGYVLAGRGFSVAAIAGLVGLSSCRRRGGS